MFKRIFVLLLCGVMLIGMLAACANQGEGEETSNTVEENTNWVNPELEFNDNLNGKDYKPYQFHQYLQFSYRLS